MKKNERTENYQSEQGGEEKLLKEEEARHNKNKVCTNGTKGKNVLGERRKEREDECSTNENKKTEEDLEKTKEKRTQIKMRKLSKWKKKEVKVKGA